MYDDPLVHVTFSSVKIIGHRVSFQRCEISTCLCGVLIVLLLLDVATRNSLKTDHSLWKLLVCEIGFYCLSSDDCMIFRENGKMTRWWILPYVTYLTSYLSRRRTDWDDTAFPSVSGHIFLGFYIFYKFGFFYTYKHSSFVLYEQKYKKPTSNFLFVVDMFTWLAVLL